MSHFPCPLTARCVASMRPVPKTAAVGLPPAGVVLIILAYHHAAGLAGEPDQLQFLLFWAGFLGAMLPLVALACSPRIDEVTRSCALVGIGLFGMAPKLLRSPSEPLGGDESAHIRQIIEAFLNGDVGHVSYLLPITQEFPGLHQLISAMADLTGLPLWQVGMAVISFAHVLSVVAVYQLICAVGASPTGAALGAVVYTLNPSWAYFDTAVSYESLALPLLLWCLAATVAASRSSPRRRLRPLTAGLLCAAVLPLVHHLTTILLFAILVTLTLTCLAHTARHRWAARRSVWAVEDSAGTSPTFPPRETVWPLLLTTACLLGSSAYWWSDKYDWLYAYLSPALTGGWTQLSQLLGLSVPASAGPSGGRAIFGGAQIPPYELISGLLFPPLALVLFLVSVYILWSKRRLIGSASWAFAVLAMTYFLSMPMVLTKQGAEGAHRYWAFSFIGIAVLCGQARSLGLPSVECRTAGASGRLVRHLVGSPGLRIGMAACVFTVLAFGSAALGSNVSSRFPGSENVGDDSRSVSREGAAVTAWIAAHVPVDTPVLADRYVSQRLGSFGRMATLKPSATFPLWDLYMSADPVHPGVLQQLLDSGVRYFVVDARMATTRPTMGYWFTKDEPGVDGTVLSPQVAIDRFGCLPWLQGTYAAGPLTVYEVHADVLRRTMAGSCQGGLAS
jgi:hypothetical protein